MAVPATLDEALATFEPVIGLEVHAQLSTNSKIFCGASTEFRPDHPNENIDVYCIGSPGALPVLNGAVVDMAIRAGLALSCTINERSIWSRKHYFYPDLPKGYQISQYDQPICEHGHLDISVDDDSKRIGVTRIHMEEDAGKNTHVAGAPYTLVDYNRAGVPLIEIVAEPDLRSAAEAAAYLRALRSILVTLGVCDGNMEEGSFRCDANVSLRPRGTEPFGTRVELKNINSFRFIEQAIDIEILRHAKVLAEGGEIVLETRLYDSNKRVTRSMRGKEEAHDYRYFPDPDLPPLVIVPERIEALRAEMPELPAAKIARYVELGVPRDHAETFALEPEVAVFFDAALKAQPSHALAIANFVKGDVLRELKESDRPLSEAPIAAEDIAGLVAAREADKISSSQAKKIFSKLWHDGAELKALLEAEGEQVDDLSVLEPIVRDVVANNPRQAAQYRSGKTNIIGFFMGQVMKATKGKAKPPLVKQLLTARLDSEDET